METIESILGNIFDCLLLPRKTKRKAEIKLARFAMLTEGMTFGDRTTIRKVLRSRTSHHGRKLFKEWDWIEGCELDRFIADCNAAT